MNQTDNPNLKCILGTNGIMSLRNNPSNLRYIHENTNEGDELLPTNLLDNEPIQSRLTDTQSQLNISVAIQRERQLCCGGGRGRIKATRLQGSYLNAIMDFSVPYSYLIPIRRD